MRKLKQQVESSRADWPWGWRTMWVICMFDLPTRTDEERQAYRLFRKRLLNDGFTMMQYSVYSRHCSSIENARSHMDRMSALVPEEGEVSFLLITDNQFARTETYRGKKRVKNTDQVPSQLQLF